MANLKLAANPSSGTLGSTSGMPSAFDNPLLNLAGFGQNQKISSYQKRKPGVTKIEDGVTKLDFDNRSRSSDNHEPLHDHDVHRKKHKKKKKNKRSREEKEKRKSKRSQNPMGLFPGMYPMLGASVDEIAASFDYF